MFIALLKFYIAEVRHNRIQKILMSGISLSGLNAGEYRQKQ